ncbi:DUF4465 domain-containing protein [Polaribacter butkevichii]|uniref:DUF4465 domain-containing protein n=1 Tax=Polaribacter butkevichii TaxID=218490 RepID=A0A2P6CB92_9FLAO|nr:DUF4465 domain-containing protein [Polaribacter butkevichii]PQJ72183.1 hypothetical protein BTO14_02480 [Polaribacter butkevichii]
MKNNFIYILVLSIITLLGCETKFNDPLPIPNDITLNELDESVGIFNHVIPTGSFTSDVATFNTVNNSDGSYSGFAYSNRNYASYTWTTTQTALDSVIYSVYTHTYLNKTKTFAVAHVKDDDAFISFENPSVVEHVLIANTSYNYLSMQYGDPYGTEEEPKQNPNIKASAIGVWELNTGGAKRLNEEGDYLKAIVKGYNGDTFTGELEFYLASSRVDPLFPTRTFVVREWMRWDLTELGEVDKLVFNLEGSDVDSVTGELLTPPYFCLDGIRLVR